MGLYVIKDLGDIRVITKGWGTGNYETFVQFSDPRRNYDIHEAARILARLPAAIEAARAYDAMTMQEQGKFWKDKERGTLEEQTESMLRRMEDLA